VPNDFEIVRFDYDPLGGKVSAGNKDIAVYTVDGRLILKAKDVYKVLIGKEKRTIIIR
jgi:hypothetical protein